MTQQYNSAKALESHLIYARSTSYWYFSIFIFMLLDIVKYLYQSQYRT
jgi:hypothetical protein